MEAIASPRYLLFISCAGQRQRVPGGPFELCLLVRADVRPIVFREAVYEDSAFSLAEQVGIHRPSFRTDHSFPQGRIADFLLSDEPLKPLRFVDLRLRARNSTQVLIL